jgi:uncharacterized LabA/DUF88 family protein
MATNLKNSAFIDSQNFYLGAKADGWTVDHYKFCRYLAEKYQCEDIYLFIGNLQNEHSRMYTDFQKAGYILIFKDHDQNSVSKKKGNVDVDLVFELMRQFAEESPNKKFILVSGDGDYFKVVRYLIEKNRFLKILLPNKKYASSLYKKLGSEYYDFLMNIKSRIEYQPKNEKGS